MTQEHIDMVNKVWQYSREELLHRRIYLLITNVADVAYDADIFPYTEYLKPIPLTQTEMLELEIIETRLPTFPWKFDYFVYPNFETNPYFGINGKKFRNHFLELLIGKTLKENLI